MKVLTVKVIAHSKHNAAQEVAPNTYDVHTSAPMERGKANREMIKILAYHLKVPQSKLMLAKGEKFQVKTVLLLDD